MKPSHNKRNNPESGQALVEYVLIVVLVVLTFVVALAATGPVIANVFSNTVFNVVSRDRLAAGVTPPSVENFWATMTWVADNPPLEVPLPTRTLPPPTLTPTAGPSPTPTATVPTATNTPTRTPAPSPTPADYAFVAPWEDSADDKIYWRLDNTFYVGSEDWIGSYYNNVNENGTPAVVIANASIDESYRNRIAFDYGSGSPSSGAPSGVFSSGINPDNFSVVWRRGVRVYQKTTLRFDLSNVTDGVRIWIFGGAFGGVANPNSGTDAGCSNRFMPLSSGTLPSTSGTKVRMGGNGPSISSVSNNNGRWSIYSDNYFSYDPLTSADSAIPTECLIVDRWMYGDSSAVSQPNVLRTVPAGYYVIAVEFFDRSGNASINVDMNSASMSENPDDVRINSGGAVIGGTPTCAWGNVNNNSDSDTPGYRWDEYTVAESLPSGNRCYLELRGSILIPTTLPTPYLTFRDLWDIKAGTYTWVEMADYDPDGNGTFDRATAVWTRIEMHNNDSYNYNWTYHGMPIPAAFIGKSIALRFGMENRSSGARNIWWIDTIKIDTVTRNNFYPKFYWNLNSDTQTSDFITSGNWALSSEERIGGTGMSWHESVGANYTKLGISRSTGTDIPNYRVHSLEFNGFIDVNDPLGAADLDGDYGNPVLTFYHQYALGQLSGIELQYSTDPYPDASTSTTAARNGATWTTVPGAVFVNRTNSTAVSTSLMDKVTVQLNVIPATRFRLRFALLVNASGTIGNGWWIDEIKLEREDRPRFTDYPFYDPAEDPLNLQTYWNALGAWGQVTGGYGAVPGIPGNSYTDSPTGDYGPNDNIVLEIKYPFDLRMDTPENAHAPNCNIGPLCQTTTSGGQPWPVPNNPYLTFWHKRILNSGERFVVEWKRKSESSTSWRILWAYEDQMTTVGTGNRSLTRVSRDWERVEISLKPVYNIITPDNTSVFTDDDVVFRFLLQTSSSNHNDGIYIDDVRLQDYSEQVWALWTTGTTSTDNTGTVVKKPDGTNQLGSGTTFDDNVENPTKRITNWYYGGGWKWFDMEQRDGVYSFHDSWVGQTGREPDPSFPITNTMHESFNVLELAQIIDLRGVDSADRPTLYFWSRYNLGAGDVARVEIAVENPALVGTLCRGGLPQCYEKVYGWSEWTTVWSVPGASIPSGGPYPVPVTGTGAINLLWNRQQIALDGYAKGVTTPGQRIRIRFVLDALSDSNVRDGWYIDAIQIRPYSERQIVINSTSSLFDGARNMNNWVGEGWWGLDPEFYRGAGGGPASLGSGAWTYNIWQLIKNSGSGQFNRCSAIPGGGDFLVCANKFLSETGTGRWNTIAASLTGLVLDINYNWGSGGPSSSIKDYFVGRWELTTGVVGTAVNPGTYTFITASDDGVRMRYVTEPGGAAPNPCDGTLCGQTWNIINNWTYHGRTVDMGTARLAAAGTGNSTGRYKITLEYFDSTGDATLSLSTGTNNFSFSDSPKQGAGLLFPEIAAQPRSSSSLILDGVLDLRTAVRPSIEYYTYYELGGNARFEVSIDGGFSWTSNTMLGSIPNSYWTTANWVGQYWTQTALDRAGAAASRTQNTSTISYDWYGSAPLTSFQTDNFGVRWTRTLTLPVSGQFYFSTDTDDGVRLWIRKADGSDGYGNPNTGSGCLRWDGAMVRSGDPFVIASGSRRTPPDAFIPSCLVIDSWENQGYTNRYTTRLLTAGTYIIQMDYYDATGDARARLGLGFTGFSNPVYSSSNAMPGQLSGTNDASRVPVDWQRRTHDLTAYAGLPAVGLRFRLDRLGVQTATEGGDYKQESDQGYSPVNWEESWWIVDITIADS